MGERVDVCCLCVASSCGIDLWLVVVVVEEVVVDGYLLIGVVRIAADCCWELIVEEFVDWVVHVAIERYIENYRDLAIVVVVVVVVCYLRDSLMMNSCCYSYYCCWYLARNQS